MQSFIRPVSRCSECRWFFAQFFQAFCKGRCGYYTTTVRIDLFTIGQQIWILYNQIASDKHVCSHTKACDRIYPQVYLDRNGYQIIGLQKQKSDTRLQGLQFSTAPNV